MNLNSLSPNPGAKQAKKRLGRGIGSGLGKTCGKGHKGQKARAGGYHKINFEGGQMPIQRRLPKMGFKSRTNTYSQEIGLGKLVKVTADVITLEVLKQHRLIKNSTRYVKVILSGEINGSLKLKGLHTTEGARAAIEQAGGSIEE